MKKVIAGLITLCLVTVVLPPVSDENNDTNPGISLHEYFIQDQVN